MGGFIRAAWLHGWSVGARLRLINALLAVALVFVSAIAWRALSAQNRAMSELALISKAARYHQDAQTQLSNLRADVNAEFSGTALVEAQRKDLLDSLDQNSRDLRHDLLTLEKLDLPRDLVETEGTVQSLADAFLARAVEIGRLAARDTAAAGVMVPHFTASMAALDAAMQKQTLAFSGHIVQANNDAALAEAHSKGEQIIGRV